MKGRAWGLLLVSAILIWGCQPGGALPPDSAATPKSVQLAEREGAERMKSLTSRRYKGFQTETIFLLLQVQDAQSGQRMEIMTTNNSWLSEVAPQLGIPTEPVSAYREYMTAHDQEPFVVPSELYRELSSSKAPQVPASISKLSDEAIIEKYFEELERHYIPRREYLRPDPAVICSLLKRGFLVTIGCESGALTVYP